MAGLYYYKHLGKEFGPVPVESLSELLASNQISTDDEVRCTSSPDWVQLKDLPEDLLPPAPAMEFADIADMDDLIVSSESSSAGTASPAPAALDFADIADMDDIELGSSSATVSAPKTPKQVEFAGSVDLDEFDLDGPTEAALDPPAQSTHEFKAGGIPDLDIPDGPPDLDIPDGPPDLDIPDGPPDLDIPDGPPDLDIPDGPPDLDIPDGPPDLDVDDLDDDSSSPFTEPEEEPAKTSDATPERERPTPAAVAKPVSPPKVTAPVSPAPSTASSRAALMSQVLSEASETDPQQKAKREFSFEFGLDRRLLIVLGIGLLIAAWIYFPSWRSYDEQYAMLDSLSKEFQALRQRKASTADWDAFVKSAEPKIAGLCEELEDGGGEDRKSSMIRRYLLFAAREYWPEMVKTARTKPNKAEERFLFCMQTVKNVMEDRPPPPPPPDEMGGQRSQGEG